MKAYARLNITVFVILSLLLAASAQAVQCRTACCGHKDTSHCGDAGAVQVFGPQGCCCGTVSSRNAPLETAVDSGIGLHQDIQPLTGALEPNPGPAYKSTMPARAALGRFAYESPPVYTLTSAYLC
jgi:hypothetical protein